MPAALGAAPAARIAAASAPIAPRPRAQRRPWPPWGLAMARESAGTALVRNGRGAPAAKCKIDRLRLQPCHPPGCWRWLIRRLYVGAAATAGRLGSLHHSVRAIVVESGVLGCAIGSRSVAWRHGWIRLQRPPQAGRREACGSSIGNGHRHRAFAKPPLAGTAIPAMACAMAKVCRPAAHPHT